MKVLKFGGTSVGSPQNMRSVMKIITDNEQKIVVLSAMSGTTNVLVEISELLGKKNRETAGILIGKLEAGYRDVVDSLYTRDDNKYKGLQIIKSSFEIIKSFTSGRFTQTAANTILSMGEILSTKLFTLLMEENGYDVKLLPALDFMRIDE
ncbi:MAG: aspartate kinase, partial [Prolixibacteraceae bacterium]|nr:aspartate kinase [Prolixibacteraceae bacterium]